MLEIFHNLYKDGFLERYDCLIIDSVAGTSTETELANDAKAANIGNKGLLISKLIRPLPYHAARDHCTVLIINQERANIGGPGGVSLPGGDMQLFASHHTIRLSSAANATFEQNKEKVGKKVTATVRKSRVTSPHKKAEFQLWFDPHKREYQEAAKDREFWK